MSTHQLQVLALIRASGERLANLRDARLLDLWRNYSLRTHQCVWIGGDAREVASFIAWAGGQPGVFAELLLAAPAAAPARLRIVQSSARTVRFDASHQVESPYLPADQQRRRVTVRFTSSTPSVDASTP